MDLIGLIVVLVVVGIILQILPIDATVKNWIYILLALVIVLVLLSIFFPGLRFPRVPR